MNCFRDQSQNWIKPSVSVIVPHSKRHLRQVLVKVWIIKLPNSFYIFYILVDAGITHNWLICTH